MAKKSYKRPDEAAMFRVLEKNEGMSVEVILRLAWTMGLAAVEMHELKWTDVSFEEGQIYLPDRTVPMPTEMQRCLQRRYDKWAAIRQEEYVVITDLRRAHMHRVHISKFASKALDEEPLLKDITLKDLREDFIIRMLEKHDWRYVAQISGMVVNSLYANYSQYMSKGRNPEKLAVSEVDEVALWQIMQKEGSSPVGLTLWLVWQHGLNTTEARLLTWEQVNLEAGIISLRNRDIAMGTTLTRILRQVKASRPDDADPHILLSPKAQKPYDGSRLSKVMQTAMLHGGMDSVALDVLSRMHRKKTGDEQILEQARLAGYITRNDVMLLRECTETQAYQQLRRLIEQKKLVRVGTRYYPAGTVESPEEHYRKICDYLEEMGTAYRQDIQKLLRVQDRQCSWILHELVAKGKLEKKGHRYSLPKTEETVQADE